jgi:transposase-like protein
MHATRPRDGSRLRDELLAAVRNGATVTIAARRLGIPRPTVYSWRSRHPEFGEALSQAVRAQRRGFGGAVRAALGSTPTSRRPPVKNGLHGCRRRGQDQACCATNYIRFERGIRNG